MDENKKMPASFYHIKNIFVDLTSRGRNLRMHSCWGTIAMKENEGPAHPAGRLENTGQPSAASCGSSPADGAAMRKKEHVFPVGVESFSCNAFFMYACKTPVQKRKIFSEGWDQIE